MNNTTDSKSRHPITFGSPDVYDDIAHGCVHGGQGRTAEDIEADAWPTLWLCVSVAIVLVAVSVAIYFAVRR